MMCGEPRPVLCLVAIVIVIVSASTADSDDSSQSKFRDKRTLDFILHGLAQMLGYSLQRNNELVSSPPPITTTTPPPPPPPPPPTYPSTTPLPPSQIVFLSLSDIVNVKRKSTTTEKPKHEKNSNFRYGNFDFGSEKRGRDKNRDSERYKSDYTRFENDKPDGGDHGHGDNRREPYYRDGYNSGKIDFEPTGAKNDERADKRVESYRGNNRNDKVDDYLERIGHYIRGQFRGGKGNKSDNKDISDSKFKSKDVSIIDDYHGSDQKWDNERVKSEYDKIKGFDFDNDDDHEVKDEKQDGDHSDDMPQKTFKDDHNNKEDLCDDKDLKEEKESSTQSSEKDNIENKDVKKEDEEKLKEKISEENTEERKQEGETSNNEDRTNSEQSKQQENTENHQENAYHNQIPAPSLHAWNDDFWNGRYTFSDSNPYSFSVLNTGSTTEQKDLHKIPDFSYGGSSDQESKELKSVQPGHYFNRPQYFSDHGFEPLHEWHVTSDRLSETSPGSFNHKESSEPKTEIKEKYREDPQDPTESPEELTVVESPEPSKLPIQRQDVTDSSPMPVHSTAKPKLAELIHEVEGTKQNPIWPPPFDHAFESTDSSVAIHPPQLTSGSSKTSGNSPSLLVNLYNYTSISDYLLDLSKKGLPQKQKSQSSQKVAEKVKQTTPQSLVSYVAVVVPNQSKKDHERSDNSLPPEPSFVGIVYPQRLVPNDDTSRKSKSDKNDRTKSLEILSKSQTSNIPQNPSHDNYDEIQDRHLERHYNPLYHDSSVNSNKTSPNQNHQNVYQYPASPFSSLTQTDFNASHYSHYPENAYQNPDYPYSGEQQPKTPVQQGKFVLNITPSTNSTPQDYHEEYEQPRPYYNTFFQNPEDNSKLNEKSKVSSTEYQNVYNQHQNQNIQQHFDLYHNPFFQNSETHPERNVTAEDSSSVLNSKPSDSYSNVDKQTKESSYYPDTFYSSFHQNYGGQSPEENKSSRASSTSPDEAYNRLQKEIINYNPETYYNSFKQPETQPSVSSFPHSSHNNYQNFQGNRPENPSPFYSYNPHQENSTPRRLRLVISETTSPKPANSRPSPLRVVVPDFPYSDSSFDYYSSGGEPNESKQSPSPEEHVGLMTIPPPTPYSDEPADLKNPDKWVAEDDAPPSKNLKTKEYITRVSTVKLIGKVHSQPRTNLKSV